MTEEDAIHTRLDYIEKIFNEKMGQMADSILQLAKSTDNLNEKFSDINLLMDRSNQHALQIDDLDKRQDNTDKILPVIERFMTKVDRISITITVLIIAGIVGSFFKFA